MLYIYHMKFSQPPSSPLKLKCMKGEVLPTTFYEDTLALDGWAGCSRCHSVAAVPLGISPVPVRQEAGWASGWSRWFW